MSINAIEEGTIALNPGETIVSVIEFRGIVFVITDKGTVYRIIPISSDLAHD